MQEVPLNGQWELKDIGINCVYGSSCDDLATPDGWMPICVPGDIHQALMEAGRIKDPLVGLNSVDCRWTEERAWWFKKEFPTQPDWLESDAVELELNGLDANALIFLNSQPLGSHPSAFRPFATDIKRHLRTDGDNTLLIRLTAGVENVTPEDLAGLGVPIRTEGENGYPERIDPRRVFVRKPQYAFGWDWNPRVATTAIGGDARIRWFNTARIRDVQVACLRDRSDIVLNITVAADSLHDYRTCPGSVEVAVTSPDKAQVLRETKKVLLRSGRNYVEFNLTIRNPKLWWPNGLGDQPLYTIEATLDAGNERSCHPPFAYGIRFVELDTDGQFAIIINGKKIFCKGANWVPPDTLYARATDEQYEQLVRLARDTGCNMLRVWGGGLYERDAFYNACDRYGILLWHDFMFACAPYPDHLEWFREEVRKEADYQTSRLRNHACLALWSGNNECIQGIVEWWQQKTRGGCFIYNQILPEIVQKNCKHIPYWNGSPYGGVTPNAQDVGDRHHWPECAMSQFMHLRITPEEYDKCTSLFVSEYGYFGPPAKETAREYLGGAAFDRTSPVWRHHNNTFEKGTVDAGIQKHYRDLDGMSEEEYFLYGGLVQGLMYSYSLESFRGRANCHGGLIWMFEDCWGEVGWALVDYRLRKKIPWYFVKRAFRPALLTLRETEGEVRVTLANDSPESIRGLLEFGRLSFDGKTAKLNQARFLCPPLERKVIATFVREPGDPSRELWIARIKGNSAVLPAFLRTTEFRNLKMLKPNLELDASETAPERWSLRVRSDVFAHAVQLLLPPEAAASDNYFDLLPGQERTIDVSCTGPLDLGALRLTSVT